MYIHCWINPPVLIQSVMYLNGTVHVYIYTTCVYKNVYLYVYTLYEDDMQYVVVKLTKNKISRYQIVTYAVESTFNMQCNVTYSCACTCT